MKKKFIKLDTNQFCYINNIQNFLEKCKKKYIFFIFFDKKI